MVRRRSAEKLLEELQNCTPRHKEVLREALQLFSQRGYEGASLRELARRVGMSQPSLYHYFRSKDELVEQIILFCGGGMLLKPDLVRLPDRLEDVPRAIVDYALHIYDDSNHPMFIRFMFAVAQRGPRFRTALARIYEDPMRVMTPLLMQPYVQAGQISAEDAIHLATTAVSVVGLKLLEQRVLYGELRTRDEVTKLGDYVVRVLRRSLEI
jgi:AcrR family transcriptional regulator